MFSLVVRRVSRRSGVSEAAARLAFRGALLGPLRRLVRGAPGAGAVGTARLELLELVVELAQRGRGPALRRLLFARIPLSFRALRWCVPALDTCSYRCFPLERLSIIRVHRLLYYAYNLN